MMYGVGVVTVNPPWVASRQLKNHIFISLDGYFKIKKPTDRVIDHNASCMSSGQNHHSKWHCQLAAHKPFRQARTELGVGLGRNTSYNSPGELCYISIKKLLYILIVEHTHTE